MEKQIVAVLEAVLSGSRTSSEISALLGISVKHASSYCSQLAEDGLIVRTGKRPLGFPSGHSHRFEYFYEPRSERDSTLRGERGLLERTETHFPGNARVFRLSNERFFQLNPRSLNFYAKAQKTEATREAAMSTVVVGNKCKPSPAQLEAQSLAIALADNKHPRRIVDHALIHIEKAASSSSWTKTLNTLSESRKQSRSHAVAHEIFVDFVEIFGRLRTFGFRIPSSEGQAKKT